MIVDAAKTLGALADEVALLRRSQQYGQALVSRTSAVEAYVARAELATRTLDTLTRRLAETPSRPAQLETAVGAIDRWRAALDDDLGEALGGDLFAGVQQSVERALKDIERRAGSAWQRYTAQVTPETSAEILGALSADPSARSTVLGIRRLAEGIRRLRERTIPDADELAAFDESVASLRSAWATLDVESLSEDVVTFLRAANSDRGAALSQLTGPVQTWLADRKLESHYVIRPSDS